MNASERIAELRAQGHQVFVKRERPVEGSRNGWNGTEVTSFRMRSSVRPQDPEARFGPRGGVTRVTIVATDGEKYVGESRCHPRDNFRKAHGLNMALGRAISAMEHGKRRLGPGAAFIGAGDDVAVIAGGGIRAEGVLVDSEGDLAQVRVEGDEVWSAVPFRQLAHTDSPAALDARAREEEAAA